VKLEEQVQIIIEGLKGRKEELFQALLKNFPSSY
jgi:hypothetical protein